ncbi:MAG: hypothetical protein KIG72_00205 [Bradymonadales bacterium]|nr:hypothetical protein [Bradymonadales bacterium]
MVFALSSTSALAQEEAPQEKLYNFDDMLIDGAFRDPQGMFERARADVKFEGVLKIERNFVEKNEETAQESAMRP